MNRQLKIDAGGGETYPDGEKPVANCERSEPETKRHDTTAKNRCRWRENPILTRKTEADGEKTQSAGEKPVPTVKNRSWRRKSTMRRRRSPEPDTTNRSWWRRTDSNGKKYLKSAKDGEGTYIGGVKRRNESVKPLSQRLKTDSDNKIPWAVAKNQIRLRKTASEDG
ncbi:hypothetical protein K0M31_002258 [Melipona bicolor]|uniref:Uncharacterized protein n=1 Tax=Melipona bicolor TaxID=60889 RepID=A0AA40KYC9_9HYME|nr:hypothetical protein K0M31_002258 [Melipona bicolor]